MTASTFTEYLELRIRDSEGKWISTEVETEVCYLYDSAENGLRERVQILSVRAESEDDVRDFLDYLSDRQIAEFKKTALSYETAEQPI